MAEYIVKPKEECREKSVLLLVKPSVSKKLDALLAQNLIKSKNDLINFLALDYLNGEMAGKSRLGEETEKRAVQMMVYLPATIKDKLAEKKKKGAIRSINDLFNALLDEWLMKMNY